MRTFDMTTDPRQGIISALKYLHAQAWEINDLILADDIRLAIEKAEARDSYFEGEMDAMWQLRRAAERPFL